MKKNLIKALLVEDNPGDARLIQEMLAESKRSTFTWHGSIGCRKGSIISRTIRSTLCCLTFRCRTAVARRRSKSWSGTCRICPIIILTGLDDEQLAISLLRSGLQDYIVKDSVNSDMLARSIRYAIERKRLEDEVRIARNELEMRVIQRTMELSEANKELREEIEQREQPRPS